jgi:ketosteroid isomerase-like protein
MTNTQATLDDSQLAATNRELAAKVIGLIGSEDLFSLLADDVVMEFPYAPSLGGPSRYEGKPAVVAYCIELFKALPGLTMRDMTYHSVAGDPTTVFIEYEADAPTPGGNSYLQIYVNKMQFRDGLLVRMREFWDPKRILDARSGAYDTEQAG